MSLSKNAVHIDAALTNMSVSYIQDEADYIGNRVFPIIPVEKSSDFYYTFGKEAWFSDEAKPRAVGGVAQRGGYELSQDKYSCTEYAFGHPVYDRVRQNADSQVNVDKRGVQLVTRKGLIRTERLFVQQFFKTGVWSNEKTGVAAAPGADEVIQFSDYAASKPVKVVDQGREDVLRETGFLPNTMVIGFELFNVLKEHPTILDKIKYTEKGIVTEALLAAVFNVERLFVAKSVVNTAKKGAAASMAFNFGKDMWLGYVNPEPAVDMPSAGYTFAWRGVSEGLGEDVAVRKYREEATRADIFEMEMSVDMKKVSDDLGVFYKNIIG